MLFSSLTFLYYFLPACILIYFILPARCRNYVLLTASLIFYFWGENKYILVLLSSSAAAYISAILIDYFRMKHKESFCKAALCIFLGFSLFSLGFFKYANFFSGTMNSIFKTQLPLLQIALPLGISFYTFQTMSYVIDIYRGTIPPERNLVNLLTYITMFPQLVAGPIVTYPSIAGELKNRKVTPEALLYGIKRFIIGLSKKIILANQLGELSQIILNSSSPSILYYWIASISYTLQIYFDFSGYSDMAIGLGEIFGFHFPENFNYPYISKSITQFWRRWHMTLGSWFRDYIYIPLGGNRSSTVKWIRNILIVWFCTGLWHGASWNFILWGLYFAFFLLAEKFFLQKLLSKLPNVFSHIYVLFTINISFVIFQFEELSDVTRMVSGMFGLSHLPFMNPETFYYVKSYFGILLLSILASTPFFKILSKKLSSKYAFAFHIPLYLILLLLSTAYLVDSSFNPFLYFRF